MSGWRAASALVTPVSALVLASCAPAPAPVPAVPREAPAPSPAATHVLRSQPPSTPELPLEQRERSRAEALMQESRWAEAATHWEILLLLRPDQQEYGKKLAEARSHSSHAAAQHLQEAEQARAQGQTSRATVLYLKALAADPSASEAAQALRDIEKERAHKANFGPSARGGNGEMSANARRSSKPGATAFTAEGRDLDSAILLLHQADYSAAVQTLEAYVRKNPHDDLGRRTLQDAYVDLARERAKEGKKEDALAYLEKAQGLRDNKGNAELTRALQSLRKEMAEDYYQQGLRAQSANLSEAIRLWEKTLKYDPDHAQAARRLDRARKMEQNLRSIQDVESKP
jgi:hypothetical protein